MSAKMLSSRWFKIAASAFSSLLIAVPTIFSVWWYIFSSTPPYQWFKEHGLPPVINNALWLLIMPVTIGVILLFLIVRSLRPNAASTDARRRLEGEIYRLVWAKEGSAPARLFLEVQITNNGIPATIVRGYGVQAKLRDGTRLAGKNITIPAGQQMVSGKYKITANKLIYEETTSPIIDGGQAGGWIGFEFPSHMELIRRPDTIITLEFHDAKGNRYFVEAPATGTGTDTNYYPGTGTKIEEIKETSPQSSMRRFGVRCGTDLYSDNILTGNIPGRYLHAEITVSPSVSACKAYLREIIGGSRHWTGQEQLTFEPSEAPDSLSKALFENIRYNLDVLLLVSTGDIVVCNHSRIWARLPRLNDLFAVHGLYDLTIDIGGENAAGETFSLRFNWTGNWQTSFLVQAERTATRLSRTTARDECLDRAVGLLKKHPIFMLPMHAVYRAKAYKLESNDDLYWICDELKKHGYDDPFCGFEAFILDSERLEFIQWARKQNGIDLSKGNSFVNAAEEWPKLKGRLQPSRRTGEPIKPHLDWELAGRDEFMNHLPQHDD